MDFNVLSSADGHPQTNHTLTVAPNQLKLVSNLNFKVLSTAQDHLRMNHTLADTINQLKLVFGFCHPVNRTIKLCHIKSILISKFFSHLKSFSGQICRIHPYTNIKQSMQRYIRIKHTFLKGWSLQYLPFYKKHTRLGHAGIV